MSSIGDAIFQIAKEVAGLARDETQSYQKKIDEAKQHLDELTRLKLAREAPTRLDSFDVQRRLSVSTKGRRQIGPEASRQLRRRRRSFQM